MIPDIKQPILLIADEGREEEVITRLSRVGYDFAIGYLDGGFEAWKKAGKETDRIETISAEKLAAKMQKHKVDIVDVRKHSEYDAEHVISAKNAPLDFINESMQQLDKNKTLYVHCASGYRSMIFNSTLRARGFNHLVDINGGFKALKESESIQAE